MLPRLALAAFTLAHAAIHLGYVSRRPPDSGGPAWPFELNRSWLLSRLGVDPGIVRLIGFALVSATLAGYGLAALAALGLAPAGLWAPAIVGASAASIGVLSLFFHPWLALGLAIDAAFLWVALAQQWGPAALSS